MEKLIQSSKTLRKPRLYGRILKYLRPYRPTFLVAMVCMVIFGATDGAVPFLVKYVLDGVFKDQNKQLLVLLPVILISFAIIRALTDFGQQYLMAKIGHNVIKDFRNDLNRKFLALSPDFFSERASGNLLSHVTSDVLLIRSLLTDSVAAIIRDSIRLVALVGSALYLDTTLAVLAVTVFPVAVYPIYVIGRRIRKLSRQGQEAIGALSSLLAESISGNRVVKIFLRENYEAERFKRKNQELTKVFVRSEKYRALTGPFNESVSIIVICGILVYGGYSVIGGARTQGDFIAFLLAIFLMYDPFKKLSRMHGTIQQGLGGAERVFEVLDAVPTIRNPENPLPVIPQAREGAPVIELKSVSYSYKPRRSDQTALFDLEGVKAEEASTLEPVFALRGVSFSLQAGEKVAIVGPSGSGKSTLVDLLTRFIDPTEGEVSVFGTNVAQADIAQLRSHIGMVTQQNFLFNDSIFTNIAYGRANASREEVMEAAKTAFAHDFIMAMPAGYETIVGEGGASLSGGERQRIAIARALLKNAPILVLDEATASLDNQSERLVQAALDTLTKNKTTIVIAHRLSTIQNADRILVLRHGRIIEEGKHPELLQGNGEYRHLWDLQFSKSHTDAQDT